MAKYQVVTNEFAGIALFVEEVNNALQEQDVDLQLSHSEGTKFVYVRVPWQKCLRNLLKACPELKADDATRKSYKSELIRMEQALDAAAEEAEQTDDVITLGEFDLRVPSQVATLLSLTLKGE